MCILCSLQQRVFCRQVWARIFFLQFIRKVYWSTVRAHTSRTTDCCKCVACQTPNVRVVCELPRGGYTSIFVPVSTANDRRYYVPSRLKPRPDFTSSSCCRHWHWQVTREREVKPSLYYILYWFVETTYPRHDWRLRRISRNLPRLCRPSSCGTALGTTASCEHGDIYPAPPTGSTTAIESPATTG